MVYTVQDQLFCLLLTTEWLWLDPGSLFCCLTEYLLPCKPVSRQSAPWPLPSSIDYFPFFCLGTDVAFNMHKQCHFVYLSSKWDSCWSSVWWGHSVLLAHKMSEHFRLYSSVSCVLKKDSVWKVPLQKTHLEVLSNTLSYLRREQERKKEKE